MHIKFGLDEEIIGHLAVNFISNYKTNGVDSKKNKFPSSDFPGHRDSTEVYLIGFPLGEGYVIHRWYHFCCCQQ